MSVTVIIGGQWGDEGKGKIVDLLSKDSKVVARFQGGANAGHTVYNGDTKMVLHQIPSGILRDGCYCILGNGMVVDPVELLEEINMVESHGVSTQDQVRISLHAHIVTPLHKAVDQATEKASNTRIGTTGKGIGPTYVDKYNRIGIRAIELKDLESLSKKVNQRLHLYITEGILPQSSIEDLQPNLDEFYDCSKQISPLVSDTFTLMHQQISDNQNILVEGAQGTLLDVDHGTYPFVTSSNASSAGVGTGLGLPLTHADTLIGIFKAYITRVGKGPFPTELFDPDGQKLQDLGHEYGATTGRPRRCGWFDAVLAKYSCMANGFTDIALTKLDILDHFEEIKICTGYKVGDTITTQMSAHLHELNKVEPVYESFKGWQSTTTGIETFDQLPNQAKAYIEKLETLSGVRISIISTGPGRDQIIHKN